jgi:hypothetical protein
MSTCAFCGTQSLLGSHYLAHRISTLRTRTVKVCERCADEARDAGYRVAEREPSIASAITSAAPEYRYAS